MIIYSIWLHCRELIHCNLPKHHALIVINHSKENYFLIQLQLWVNEYSTDMKGASIKVLGVEKGNGTTLTRSHNKTLLNSNNYKVCKLN